MNSLVRGRQAFVGAGANLGDRAASLIAAMERLRSTEGILAVESSSIYETAPVGYLPQPAFLNLVLGLETTLDPEGLLAVLLRIEQEFGRVRSLRWGPRTLDLDLLGFENEFRATDFLQLPHPRLFERAFVTVPLGDVLGRNRFRHPSWDAWRARLATLPVDSGVRFFAS